MTICKDPVLFYAPFATGKYDTTSPGLSHFRLDAQDPGRRLIQLDESFPEYRENKRQCRAAGLQRAHLEQDLAAETLRCVNQTLIEALCASYPQYFRLESPGRLCCRLTGDSLSFTPDYALEAHGTYTSLWDALAAQIQEDMAIWQLKGERDYLAGLHVCAPNGWAPAEKIGQSFAQVHAHVPGMARQNASYLPMLRGLIQKPAYARFLWDLRTCGELNHHPEDRPHLPPFDADHPSLYVRLERQVLYGLPECDAVLFMIRTYRYRVRDLSRENLFGLDRALAGMPEDLLAYKRLNTDIGSIRAWLGRIAKNRDG